MQVPPAKADLYLNGRKVGTVIRRGMGPSWGYGRFIPDESFAPFAPLFGRWSLLMHADAPAERLSADASDELRRAESALDALEVQLYWPANDQWECIRQVNIDADLIEWKRQ